MTFELQPTLTGELITLRPLAEEDFDNLYKVAGDPLLWEQHPAGDRYKKDVFKKLFDESICSGGALVAIENHSGETIGSSRYHGYSAENSDIEIGWSYLARKCWGGKYNKEMKKLMLDHAFKYVETVLFIIGVNNIRSQKAIEKIGGVKSGNRKDASGNDSIVYQIKADVSKLN